MGLRLIVGPCDGRRQRLVITQPGDDELFRNRLDTDVADHRRQLFKDLSRRLDAKNLNSDVSADRLAAMFEADLVRQADEADREAARLAAEARARQAENDRTFEVPDVQPWPEPVQLQAVLDETRDAIHRYVYLPDHAAAATALWSAGSHVFNCFDLYPLLVVQSPTKRCGKSLLLNICTHLAARPLSVSNLTPAVLFRVVELCRPTLLIDEADAWLASNEGLRGLLNAGHSHDAAFVVRSHPVTLEPERFSVWAPKAIATIGDLPGTVEDRSILIRLDRKPQNRKLLRLNRRAKADIAEIGRRFARWALDHAGEIDADAEPDLPDGLNDRASDNWRPLLALADMAGGDWPQMARRAAIVLSGDEDLMKEEAGVRLLASIAEILPNLAGDDFILTSDLTTALQKMEEWYTYSRGKPITPPTRWLAS